MNWILFLLLIYFYNYFQKINYRSMGRVELEGNNLSVGYVIRKDRRFGWVSQK